MESFTASSEGSEDPGQEGTDTKWKEDRGGHLMLQGILVNNRYEVLKSIDSGTFGKVWKIRDIRSELWYAMKVSLRKKYREDIADVEVDTLKRLNRLTINGTNSLIVSMWDSFILQGRSFIIMELMGTSVHKFLQLNNCQPFPAKQGLHIASQLLEAVQFLHRNNFMHTDIKPENMAFVYDAYDTVANTPGPDSWRNPNKHIWPSTKILKQTDIRILDLGSAVLLSPRNVAHRTGKIGSRPYRSPESLLQQEWNKSADMWSVGCTMMEVWTGKPLFQRINDDCQHLHRFETILGPLPDQWLKIAPPDFLHTRHMNMVKGPRPWEKEGDPLPGLLHPIPTRLSNYFSCFDATSVKMSKLIRQMLQYEPTQRITVQEALKDPLFNTESKFVPVFQLQNSNLSP